MNYIQYMKPGSKFWLNLGDAIKYARSTSTLDGGGAYYITSQAKEDLREQGKEDEAREIEKAEVVGTVGGAIAGLTLGKGVPLITRGISAFRTAFPKVATGIDLVLTADGIRNLATENGILKTVNYIKDGNWGRAVLSGTMDALDLLGGVGIIGDAIKGYKYIKHISNPKSVLDWSFNSWFNLNGRANANFYDKVSLLKHRPEYVDIELLSKANGTWLQMNDGTMFKGDPREWVMMQSKAFKNSGLGETQVISGDWAHRIPNTSNYDVWGVTDKDIYKAYNFGTDGFGRTTVYGYVYPKKSKILEINLPKEGIYWGQIPKLYIPAKSNLYPHQSVLSADNIIEGSKNNGFDITRINNVIEGTPGNSPVDDIIIHANTPRKIISGSNGNFNMRDKNPFKIVVPGLIATGIITEVDARKSGGSIHIKKKNKGKFTDYCGGKVTEECIRKGKNSSNPTTRKRANFAANARKWKHEDGGKINYLNCFQYE